MCLRCNVTDRHFGRLEAGWKVLSICSFVGTSSCAQFTIIQFPNIDIEILVENKSCSLIPDALIQMCETIGKETCGSGSVCMLLAQFGTTCVKS